MPGDQFLDTNVLIYAFAANDARSAQAESLLANGGVIGVQVLNEFTNVTRRKLGWEWPQTEAALGVIEDLLGPALPLTMAIHSRAVALARDHTMAFYDALIVAAAIDARCRVLLSEDLQHGRKFGSLTINNPFR
ncbi:MAG: PIN domain-containing protein [Proteobacteria bacterium]|nr:PIN domain-containing protein [Pseudomonadota bacterium]